MKLNIDNEVKPYLYCYIGTTIGVAIVVAHSIFAEPEIRRATIYETNSGNNMLHLDKFGRDGKLYEDPLNSGKYSKLEEITKKGKKI